MRSRPSPILSAALVVMSAAAFAGPNIQAGLWEITTHVEVAGMQANLMPATVRQCIRAADLEKPEAMVPQGARGDCRVMDYRMQGNTASWRLECTGAAAMSGATSITYSGASYSGTMKIATRFEGRTAEATSRFSGRRVGDCE